MSTMMIVGIAAGTVLALVVACVIIAAMFPPKEYKGDLDASCSAKSECGHNHKEEAR